MEAAREVAGDATIVATSATDGTGLDAVRAALPGGGTVVLIGPSGAGKSTLRNALLGHEVAKVSDQVRLIRKAATLRRVGISFRSPGAHC